MALWLTEKATAQGFKLMRFDETYAYDSTGSFYGRLKHLPLTKGMYVSVGGSARVEYVDFHNEDWGRLGIGHNAFLLQRYDVHADVHLGRRLRMFAQLRSAWEGGRKNGPRPIDEDHLNLQNLFVDVTALENDQRSLVLRAGKQELDYGSGRLISVREGPNLRLYFTGAKVMYRTSRLRWDAFAMMADTVKTGVFDNKPTRSLNLWGSYATLIIPKMGNLDGYYLGIQREGAVFEEGTARELRHTIGGRFWKYGGGFIYNLEWAYQFGSFGPGRISAWTGSVDLGYSFETTPGKPTINLRHDYISGDRKAGDGNLQTFNPLYPKGGYFGFSPQIGPVNLIDIHPYATVSPSSQWTIQADAVFNWRYSLGDGVYRPSGGFNLGSRGASGRYIGTAWLLSTVYAFSRFVSANVGIQYFQTGSYLNEIIPFTKNGIFINARTAVKF